MDKIKILVVDDESRMRKLVKDFLVREGYIVLEAGDGMEAMDLFYEEKDIALVILDVMMPKMDGWQVCREIREHSRVPVIMLTARSDERDDCRGLNWAWTNIFPNRQSEDPCRKSRSDPAADARSRSGRTFKGGRN
mgnify:CR=1 FL=1